MTLFTSSETMMKPKISVLMPVFNNEKTISEAIESILNQTFGDFELIIINDGSTDKSDELIKMHEDKRIVYSSFQDNLGLVPRLNFGLNKAKGEFIARMDGDDIADANRLQKQLQIMTLNKEIGVCGTFIKYFGEYNGYWHPPVSHDEISANLILGSTICHPTVMIRQSVLEKNKIFYEDVYNRAEDYHLWWKLSKVTILCNLDIELLHYRVSSNQVSTIYNDAQSIQKKQIQKEIIKELIFLENGEFDLFFNPENKQLNTKMEVDLIFNIAHRINQANMNKNVFDHSSLKGVIAIILLEHFKTLSNLKIYFYFKLFRLQYWKYYSLRMHGGVIKEALKF
jgi:glycosyltransferase involved in cell wall biosynthesis